MRLFFPRFMLVMALSLFLQFSYGFDILPITGNAIDQPLVSHFCGSGNPTAIIGTAPSSGNATVFFQWQRSTDDASYTSIDGASSKDYKPEELTVSTYYRRIAMSGGCGLSSISNSILMAVIPPMLRPEAVNSNLITCLGSSVTLSVKNPLSDITYNWYAAASGGVPMGVGNAWITPAVRVKTRYYLEAVNKEGCTYEQRQPVEVDVWPVLAAPVVKVEQTTQHSVTFNWESISGATGYMISIDNGLTYQTPSSGANGLSHTLSGLQSSKKVTIQVRAIGELACQDSGNSTLITAETVEEFDGIFIPNAFTPNKDGKNDMVFVRSQTLKTMRFYIYSQWGAQLFYSTNIADGWEGTFRGVPQPIGVYMYTLRATMNDGREIDKKGTITLIR